MHKSAIIFLLGTLVMLLPFGTSLKVMAFEEYEYQTDQYENYVMDMANDNYYKSQNTVSKEMFICSEPTVVPTSTGSGFQFFNLFCQDSSGNIPDPDSPVWIPWKDCNVTDFCPIFNEEDFVLQIEQNPWSNFIRYEFPGTSQGRSVIVESGTYQISEEGNVPDVGTCPNPSYDGFVGIVNSPPPQPGSNAFFCFILEDDCSGTIEAGEEKTCTVRNYLNAGTFGIPIGG